MKKDKFISKKNYQFEDYLKIGLFGEYDCSPILRIKHQKYMEKYRDCLMAICNYTKDFENRIESKAIVWCYVYTTIQERYKYPPNEVLKLIKELNETENAEFRDILEEIKNRKPVKHKCPKCEEEINIPADYRHHNFHCLKCFDKLRRKGC